MKYSAEKPDSVEYEYRKICISKDRMLTLLIVKPKNFDYNDKRPGVLWIHGGGYMSGAPERLFVSRGIDLVTRGGAVVVSPEYSLSVTSPYPEALDECHQALLYIKNHADELGIKSDQIMVGGESAGGGLTVALCMYALDHNTVNIAFHMPLYPMLDCYDTETSRDNHEKVWNTAKNHMAWKLYLRDIKKKKHIPCYASPARRKNYKGLPPCYTFVGDIEPFYAETMEYAENLRAAGVDVKVDVYQGFYHAYDMMQPEAEDAVRAADVFIENFIKACRKYHAPQNKE